MNPKKKAENIWFPIDLINSKAWLELKKPSSFKVLMRFYLKRQVWNENVNHPRKKFKPLRDKDGDVKITNNGKIEFCYSEAENQLGLSSATFAAAIDELVEHGFIDIARTGYGVQRIKTLYEISKRWRLYGTPDFVRAERQKRPINRGFKKSKKHD